MFKVVSMFFDDGHTEASLEFVGKVENTETQFVSLEKYDRYIDFFVTKEEAEYHMNLTLAENGAQAKGW